MRLILLVPAGLAIGSLFEWFVVRHAPQSLAADLAQPLAVATAWHGIGLWVLVALGTGAAIAGVGYVTTIRALLARERSRPLVLLAVVAAACGLGLAAAFFAPVMLSSDVYAYATYGEMALRGLDPYSHAPLTLADPIFAATIRQWGNPPPVCVYGPLFVAISRALVAATAGLGVAAQLDWLRALAMSALLACVPLAYLAFASLGQRARLVAAAAIALNPVAIWSAAEGHNDALLLAFALAGFALVRRFGVGVGTAIVAFSASLKAPGVIAALAFVLAQRGRNARLASLAGLIVAVALLLAWCLPAAVEIARGAAHGGRYLPSVSLSAIGPLCTIVIVGLLTIVGIRALLRREIDGWATVALALWCALPNPYPWYALWFLPVAALAPRSRVAAIILALSLTTTLRYLPDVYGQLNLLTNVGLSLLAFAPLLALLRPKSAILSDPA